MSLSRGESTRAGMLLSKFLRKIAEEETELVDDPNCGQRQATKAEALARLIFKMALGYTEKTVETVGDKEIERERVIKPDRAMISLIWDRLEGKVGSDTDRDAHGLSLAERVTEAGKKRIKAAGAVDAGGHS